MRERSRVLIIYTGLWQPGSSSEVSSTDSTFQPCWLGGGRVRKILSTGPTADSIAELPTMHGPSTENISPTRHTFDSTALGLAESSHEQTGRKSEAHFIDNWSTRGRSLTVIHGGPSSISAGSSTISREEVSSRRRWARLCGL